MMMMMMMMMVMMIMRIIIIIIIIIPERHSIDIFLGHPAHRQLVNRLIYPGSTSILVFFTVFSNFSIHIVNK